VGTCHHGILRPGIVVGGDGLQMWTVAVSLLNKQSRTVGKV
jgi:hypothetical protein